MAGYITINRGAVETRRSTTALGSAMARWCVLFIFLLFTACTLFPDDKEAFSRDVGTWRLRNSTVDEATSLLEAQEFLVRRSDKGSPWRQYPELLVASKRGASRCFPGHREWQVLLAIRQERIEEVSARVFDYCF
jgi:hypothetical protein